MTSDSFQSLIEELARVLRPLESALKSPEAFNRFVNTLGWLLPDDVEDLGLTGLNISGVIDAVEQINDASAEQRNDTAVMAQFYLELTEQVYIAMNNLVDAVERIEDSGVSAPYLATTGISERFFSRLVSFLLVEYLKSRQFNTYNTLKMLGIITEQHFSADAEIFQSEHTRYLLHFDRIPNSLVAPDALLRQVYEWGQGTVKLEQLLVALGELLSSFGAHVGLSKFKRAKEEKILGREVPDNAEYMPALDISLYRGFGFDPVAFGIETFGLRPEQNNPLNAGIGFSPFIKGTDLTGFELANGWSIEFDASIDVDGGFALLLRPDSGLQVISDLYDVATSNPLDAAEFMANLVYRNEQGSPLFAIDGLGNLSIEQFKVGAGVGLVGSNEFDFLLAGEISGGELVLDGGNSDGFISSLLPDGGFSTSFDLGFLWSSQNGLSFRGSGGLELVIPLHYTLGTVEINQLTVAVGAGADGIPAQLGISFAAQLGPIGIVVENIGVSATFSFPGSGGNLGPMDINSGFKAPDGMALSIDSGTVSGGGYLYFDNDKQEYAGIVNLDLNGIVSVTAIGLVTTRMPDGSDGFSLLLVITTEFGSPIQLGLGFTLSAVGGLLGLNRAMLVDRIAAGVRDGGINSIMFPDDVLLNAPRIISDLKNYFPVEQGTFLVGPMMKIGWGTPNLVTLSVGVIVEIPGDLAIVGVLRVALPDEDVALINIQVNFVGAVDFNQQYLWFFASLFDSRVLSMTLEGEMGLLVDWSNKPNFIISVGGFHPAYNPPSLPFGSLARIAVSLLNTSNARLRAEGYFAVTSNTVQFGAGVEVYFGLRAFRIEGHIAFDALFRFSPFYFVISISSSFSVKVFGVGLYSIRLRGQLEGPAPWHIEGSGGISLLFFDIDVDFSHTWGAEEDTELGAIPVLALITDEYEKNENWQAVLPNTNALGVTLRSIEQGAADLIVHPVGSLLVSQRAVPLDVTIDKVGNQAPADANHFDLSVATEGVDKHGDIRESFARGQFFEASDNALLDAPGFETMQGGVELSVEGESYRTTEAVKRTVRYERIIIDNQLRRFMARFYAVLAALFALFLGGNAMSKSKDSYRNKKQLNPYREGIKVSDSQYGVVLVRDNSPLNQQTVAFDSYTEANEYMRNAVANDPTLGDELQVIPSVEVNQAA